MFGGGGLNPRKMKQMMEQMGIDLEELEAESVVITLADGTDLVFDEADVTKMEARGQETYQIVGEPTEAAAELEGDEDAAEASSGIPEEDVELVAQQAGVDQETARSALEATDGDLANAISRLE